MPDEPGTLNFPTLLDSVISLIEANNHASAALSSGINNSVLLIPVTQISEFSASGYATILDVVPNPTVIEIVKYTSKSGSDLVVPVGGRGQQGTAAAAFSGGAIVEQRHTQRHHGVLRDAIIEIQKKLGYSAVFRPLDPVGTNQAGAHLDLMGGAGTGNGVPGLLAARYPLVGASGSAVQSPSANRYPLKTNMFTATNAVTVANTTTETSLFGTGSLGSTRSIEANIARVGRIYRIVIGVFTLSTTGTPTGRLRVKVGSVTVADTGAIAFTTANLSTGGQIICDLQVTAIGAGGSITAAPFWLAYVDSGGLPSNNPIRALFSRGTQAIDLSAAQDIDITWQWGTASSSNSIITGPAGIDIAR